MTWSRRALVVTLLGGACAFLGRLVPQILGCAPTRKVHFIALGRAYLTAGGSKHRASAFLRQAQGDARRSGCSLAQVVGVGRTADFQSGNTLLLDGWLVAESEALFCAGLAMGEAAGT